MVLELRGDIVFIAYTALSIAFFHFSANCWSDTILLWLAWSLVPLALIATYRLSPMHPLARFPGPHMNLITEIWAAYSMSTGKRHLEIASLHDKYGAFVRTGPNALSINSSEAAKIIYASSNALDKSNAYRLGRMFSGGLFFIRRKDIHGQRRRIWANVFSPSSISYASTKVLTRGRQLAIHLAAQPNNELIDLSVWFRRYAYDVMGDLTFGKSSRIELMQDGDERGVVWSVQNATVMFEVLGQVPMLFDVMCYLPRMFMEDIHTLRDLASELLATRKHAEEPELDICSHLLKPDTELSEEELENDTVLAIQAGSDATAGVLTLLFYYILSDRDVYLKLTAELEIHFARGRADEDDDFSALLELPYLGAVVHEVLRFATPHPGLQRVVPPEGCVIDSQFIPGGTLVSVSAYARHTSRENFWPHPLEFKPQRWLPGGLGPGSVLNRSAMFSFSAGPFGCLGKALAMRQLYIATAYLLRDQDMRLAPSFDDKLFKAGMQNMRTAIFQYPLAITVHPRV